MGLWQCDRPDQQHRAQRAPDQPQVLVRLSRRHSLPPLSRFSPAAASAVSSSRRLLYRVPHARWPAPQVRGNRDEPCVPCNPTAAMAQGQRHLSLLAHAHLLGPQHRRQGRAQESRQVHQPGLEREGRCVRACVRACVRECVCRRVPGGGLLSCSCPCHLHGHMQSPAPKIARRVRACVRACVRVCAVTVFGAPHSCLLDRCPTGVPRVDKRERMAGITEGSSSGGAVKPAAPTAPADGE